MPNEQTAETNVVLEDSNADIIQEQEQVNEEVFEETAEETAQSQEQEVQQPQSREQNSENARRRREAKRQAELKEARAQATIDALDGINPYTQEPMKDSQDVEEYYIMKKIAAEGGDPVGDYAKHIKQKARKDAETKAQEEKTREWYKKDRAEFMAKYPDTSLEELLSDKHFIDYSEGKVGRKSLSSIYEGYIALKNESAKKANAKARQMVANAKSSPGSLTSPNNVVDSDFITEEQVEKMSRKERIENFDKIRASMAKWPKKQ
ncbi:MAG: hypothetical protein IJ033_03830 [Clostridia bacterium]|nr:hypothetical protein [Clostridia bacterium]